MDTRLKRARLRQSGAPEPVGFRQPRGLDRLTVSDCSCHTCDVFSNCDVTIGD